MVDRRVTPKCLTIALLQGIPIVWLAIALGFALSQVVGFVSVFVEFATWLLWPPVISIGWARRKQTIGSPLHLN